MRLTDIFVAMLLMGVLILLAQGLHLKLLFLRRYFIPTSVVAGLLGLLLGPQVIGEAALWPQTTTAVMVLLLVWRIPLLSWGLNQVRSWRLV